MKSDGTTPLITYDTYSVGDQITVVGEQYYVIADSPATDDYVVALKANPLTTSEITTYGTGHVNVYNSQNGAVYDIQGIGGMVYYTSSLCGPQNPERPWQSIDDECITSYGQSEVKYSVDAWADAKFTDELKTVDGYSARLITYEELVTGLGCTTSNCSNSLYSWTYDSNYSYYTMTPWQYDDQPSSTNVWLVYSDGSVGGSNVYSSSGAIRPVINVYKSAISS